jgi:DNA-binding transcriptional ArsR family regulator
MVGGVVTVAVLAEVLSRFGHALSDPTRTRLMLELREGPAYPADLAEKLGVSRTKLWNHLACLRGCGLVVAEAEGRRMRYELADRRLGHALDDLLELALAVDPDTACAADEDGSCR